MHMRGTPSDMATKAFYPEGQEIDTVAQELQLKIKQAFDEGVLPWHVIVDPGIGFAKKNSTQSQCVKRPI